MFRELSAVLLLLDQNIYRSSQSNGDEISRTPGWEQRSTQIYSGTSQWRHHDSRSGSYTKRRSESWLLGDGRGNGFPTRVGKSQNCPTCAQSAAKWESRRRHFSHMIITFPCPQSTKSASFEVPSHSTFGAELSSWCFFPTTIAHSTLPFGRNDTWLRTFGRRDRESEALPVCKMRPVLLQARAFERTSSTTSTRANRANVAIEARTNAYATG
jgi:hypothetical protein